MRWSLAGRTAQHALDTHVRRACFGLLSVGLSDSQSSAENNNKTYVANNSAELVPEKAVSVGHARFHYSTRQSTVEVSLQDEHYGTAHYSYLSRVTVSAKPSRAQPGESPRGRQTKTLRQKHKQFGPYDRRRRRCPL